MCCIVLLHFSSIAQSPRLLQILLTGTPVQNNLTELYALLSFVAPRKFRLKRCDDFIEQFSAINTKKADSKTDAVRSELHQVRFRFE